MNWLASECTNNTTYSIVNTFHDSSYFPNYEINTYVSENKYNAFEDKDKLKDEVFINDFVKSKCGNRERDSGVFKLKIFEAKNYLKKIESLKNELSTACQLLDATSSEFDDVWKNITDKQNEINDLLLKFNEEAVRLLKSDVRKRKKKRVWLKNRRAALRAEREEKEKTQSEKHMLIDKILLERSKEVEDLKRKEALTRQADTVLHEVRRKKYEAKKMCNLLAALMKLRELRSSHEVSQGGYCSEQVKETFNGVLNHIKNLWDKQMEVYLLEEKGLKLMLEESEVPQEPSAKIPTFQKMLDQWQQAFFGIPSLDDCCRYLTQADSDVRALLCVRKDWDQYITDSHTCLSSCIPPGWVVPPKAKNEEWEMYVCKRKP